MHKKLTVSLAAGIALGGLIAWGSMDGQGVPSAQAAAAAKTEENAAPVFHGFAGAFLAGRSADIENDTEAAISFYRKALEYDPANTEIRERLMVALFTGGHFDQGVEVAKGLAEDPAVEQVREMALAIDALRNQDFEKAASLLDTASTNPIDRLTNTLISAWAQFGGKDRDAAIARVTSLEGPPWYPVFTLFSAAMMAEAKGDDAKARELYQSLITDKARGSAAPDTYIRAVMALAALEARNGNQRAALDTLSVGEDFSPNYAPLTALRQAVEKGQAPGPEATGPREGAAAALFALGSALNRQGAEEAVGLYLQFARALDPSDAATLVMLGSLKEELGKTEEAISIYKEVPKDSPMGRVSELQLGLALSDLGRGAEAREHLKALIQSDPNDLRSYLAYGSVLSAEKDYREMADNYEKAIKVAGPAPDKNDWNLYFQLGIAYERLKQWPKAEANFKRALQLYPNQPQVMNYLGYSWIDMNMNLEEGMEMIRAAVDLRPNDGYIVDSLGWAYYRLGQYEDAVRELERAIELKPADATINDHLGDAYWQVGRKLEAGFQWKRALASEPDEELRARILQKLDTGLPNVAGRERGDGDPAPAPEADIKQPKAKAAEPEQRGSRELLPGEWRPATGLPA